MTTVSLPVTWQGPYHKDDIIQIHKKEGVWVVTVQTMRDLTEGGRVQATFEFEVAWWAQKLFDMVRDGACEK